MIAGIGFRRSATLVSVLDALERAGGGGLRAVALPQAKLHHPAALALANAGYALTPITAPDMAAQSTLSDSESSRAAHGVGSVAEACALAAAGPGARLTAARAISGDRIATAAIAIAGDPE